MFSKVYQGEKFFTTKNKYFVIFLICQFKSGFGIKYFIIRL